MPVCETMCGCVWVCVCHKEDWVWCAQDSWCSVLIRKEPRKTRVIQTRLPGWEEAGPSSLVRSTNPTHTPPPAPHHEGGSTSPKPNGKSPADAEQAGTNRMWVTEEFPLTHFLYFLSPLFFSSTKDILSVARLSVRHVRRRVKAMPCAVLHLMSLWRHPEQFTNKFHSDKKSSFKRGDWREVVWAKPFLL